MSSKEKIHEMQTLVKGIEGKTIKKVNVYDYLHFDCCIEDIEFTDGTILDLCGAADCCIVSALVKKEE